MNNDKSMILDGLGRMIGSENMKRTPQNCTIADTMWDRDDPQRYDGDKCFGVYDDDGAIDKCRECKEYFLYEE